MKILLVASVCFVVVGVLSLAAAGASRSQSATLPADVTGPLLSHDVFFTLKDRSDEAVQQLVKACKKYLAHHPGTVFFSAGTRAVELDRPVNDQEFDVALHVVFQNKAYHDQYQEAPRHLQFVEENRDNWAKVRVFDSYVEQVSGD